MAENLNTDLSAESLSAISEWVFCRTMVDLERRINIPQMRTDRYEILQIAPLLRKLLIDGGNLVNRVNRRHKLKIEFELVPFAKSDLDCFEMIQLTGLDGGLPLDKIPYWRVFEPSALMPRDGVESVSLGLSHFLAAHIGVVTRKRVSVRDLVQFYCIVEGGVHIGEGRNPLEKGLLATVPQELKSPMFGINQSPIGMLLPIAEIVKAALLPLMKAVTADPAEMKGISGFRATSWGGPLYEGWGGPELNRES
ncbi:hypothetical protein MUN77_01755 [Leucobacter allii]|uniref:hypothetical protein n=1 Tax=Leucobacter allii TaxID=2932247 RepID=UPI001FD20C66|nr:hypothetical protein [Leucobacter allii]UOR02085.1 hypothetical protein MUN77_01755 [Leucobacter allii]